MYIMWITLDTPECAGVRHARPRGWGKMWGISQTTRRY